MIDTYHAKRFHELLGEVIAKYEKEFGKIDKPKAIKIIEKKNKKNSKNKTADSKTVSTPSYLG